MVVDGIQTNIPLQQRILAVGGFGQGGQNSHYLEKQLAGRKDRTLSIGRHRLRPCRSGFSRELLLWLESQKLAAEAAPTKSTAIEHTRLPMPYLHITITCPEPEQARHEPHPA